MEPPMKPLPAFSQIQHVKHLLEADLFCPATIARLTGVPFRDVFRIAKSMLSAILIAPDGTHRLATQ